VRVSGGFWGPRLETNRTRTLPIEYQQSKETGRIDAFRLAWKPGDPNLPHHFWDSDVAKWIEAAAYSLTTHPDPALEALVDDVIALIAAAQQPDGYLNIHFTVVEPQNRWSNLRDMHELYCAGHLTEAAVAYFQATGKTSLLDVLRRYVDYIATVFGPGVGQSRGYPGHEELELALVKLYRVTGEQRYLDLARFFVDERGAEPHYFTQEALARGDDPARFHGLTYAYNQSHQPVREQTTAEGHAVRAMYLFTAMADLAIETGDPALRAACERLWDNVTLKRMYVTGGIGSSSAGERFTYDYDLRNDLGYNETCAAIGLVFWAHRMVQLTGDAKYTDVMERALYNGVLSGVSLDGERFFYANPLEVKPADYDGRPDLYRSGAVKRVRQEWFGCACCPPNIARLLASLGEYAYGVGVGPNGADAVYVHLYVNGEASMMVNGQPVRLVVETNYPWEEEVRITIDVPAPTTFTLTMRFPDWCHESGMSTGNTYNPGGPEDEPVEEDYVRVHRTWEPGDVVELTLEMPVERVEAHPAVGANNGRVALQRGPVVYCLEEVDNGPRLDALALFTGKEVVAKYDAELLGGVVKLRAAGKRRSMAEWEGVLYTNERSELEPATLTFVPYYAWCNRHPGELLVWVREA
jgi:DUF1680 family protein